jgi:hypothetical protein
MIDTVRFWQYRATGNLIELPPLPKQCGALLWVALLHLLDAQDPIRTEIPKIRSKLAPTHE